MTPGDSRKEIDFNSLSPLFLGSYDDLTLKI